MERKHKNKNIKQTTGSLRVKRIFSFLIAMLLILINISDSVLVFASPKHTDVLQDVINGINKTGMIPIHYKTSEDDSEEVKAEKIKNMEHAVKTYYGAKLDGSPDSLMGQVRNNINDLTSEFNAQFQEIKADLQKTNSNMSDEEVIATIGRNEKEKYADAVNTIMNIQANVAALNVIRSAYGLTTAGARSSLRGPLQSSGASEEFRNTPSDFPESLWNNKEIEIDEKVKLTYDSIVKSIRSDGNAQSTMGILGFGMTSDNIMSYLNGTAKDFELLVSLHNKTGGGELKNEENKQLTFNGETRDEGSNVESQINEEVWSSAELEDFVKNKLDLYTARLDIFENLGHLLELYANSDIKSDSTDNEEEALKEEERQAMKDAANRVLDTIKLNEEIVAGMKEATGADPSKKNMEDLPSSYRQMMPDIFDPETKQLNALYQNLFAWTANFTPFVTNVYDDDIKGRLTDEELDMYNAHAHNRSIVYTAVGENGIAKGIRSGTPYQYRPISLAEFIDRSGEKETLLFIKMKTFTVDMDVDIDGIEDLKVTQSTASTGNADDILSQGQGPKDPSKLNESEKSAALREAESSSKKMTISSMPWKLVNGSINDPDSKDGASETAEFVGPIYASSGKSLKEIHTLNDVGSSVIERVLNPEPVNKYTEKVRTGEDIFEETQATEPRRIETIEREGVYKTDIEVKHHRDGERTALNGSPVEMGTITLPTDLYNKYGDGRIVWIEGYGYAKVIGETDDGVFADVGMGGRDPALYTDGRKEITIMDTNFKPDTWASPVNPSGKYEDYEVYSAENNIIKEDRPGAKDREIIKESIFEGERRGDIASNSINRIVGNTMNMNYFLMHNNLMSKRQFSSSLQEDMNKPLYTDFLGNILTQSGFVVVPAAANYTYYNSSADLPMFNAAFLNSYPDLIFDETQQYTNTNSIDKQKFIYQKNKDGLVTIKQLSRSGITQYGKFESLPLASRVKLQDTGQTLNFMDDITMFKPNIKGFFKSADAEDESNNLVFVNTGGIFQKLTPSGDNIVNLKNISTNGNSVDWDIIKQVNRDHIDVSKQPILNQELLTATAITTELSDDGSYSKVITDYESKDEQLRNKNSFVRLVGELFESVTNRLFSLMPTNYLLYTPSPGNIPFAPNLGVTIQKTLMMVAILTFIYYIVKFSWSVLTGGYYGVRNMVIALLVIAFTASSISFVLPVIVDTLYNKPTDYLLKNEAPMYVMEGIEQAYREESPDFFDTTGTTTIESNPSITLAKITSAEASNIRKETYQTPMFKSLFYLPKLDNSKIYVLGDKVYLQGREIKMDVKDLFDIVQVRDKVDTNKQITLDLTYSGYGEIANYMPFIQIAESLTKSINDYNNQTKSPYRTIQYSKGLTKSTGRTEDFVKSIAFIAPDLLQAFTEDLLSEYMENATSIESYYNQYTMPEELKNDPSTMETGEDSTEGNEVGITYGDFVAKIDARNKERYNDINIVLGATQYLEMKQGENLGDWLGLKKVLMLQEDEALFPRETYSEMKHTFWFPQWQENIPEERWNQEIDRKIDRVNENTRKFVVNKLIPISGYVSDDTLIKIISLYATMEYNKEFEDVVNTKLYPKYYNVENISNYYTSKTTLIPTEEIFITGTNKLGLFLARETGSPGLILGLISMVLMFIRMNIRIILLSFIIITLPFMLLYLYAIKQNKHTRYVFGSMAAILIIAFLYVIELLGFRISTYIVNKVGTTQSLTIMLIPSIFMTYLYLKYLKTILLDLSSFGFDRVQEGALRLVGGMSGVDMDAAYQEMAHVDNSYYVNDTSGLKSPGSGGYSGYGDTGYGGVGYDASSYGYTGRNMTSFEANPYVSGLDTFGEDVEYVEPAPSAMGNVITPGGVGSATSTTGTGGGMSSEEQELKDIDSLVDTSLGDEPIPDKKPDAIDKISEFSESYQFNEDSLGPDTSESTTTNQVQVESETNVVNEVNINQVITDSDQNPPIVSIPNYDEQPNVPIVPDRNIDLDSAGNIVEETLTEEDLELLVKAETEPQVKNPRVRPDVSDIIKKLDEGPDFTKL